MRMMGGLGNQLFQYALGRFLAEKNQTFLYIDLSYYRTNSKHPFLLDKFYCSYQEIKRDQLVFLPENERWYKMVKWAQKIIPVRHRNIISDFSAKYRPAIKTATPPVYLEGYWQSPKYFEKIKTLVREECRVKDPPQGENADLLARIRENHNPVCLHVRRGDFVNDEEIHEKHGICSMDYYQRAIEIIRREVEEPTFFVFSDDKQFVQDQFGNDEHFVIVKGNKVDEAHEDLRLMYHCNHFIIANSTFSWWGAWLSSNKNKTVIAPEDWFKNKRKFTISDLIPDSWKLI